MQEIWKSVPGYEGFYEVSNFGQVRSIDRITLRKDGTPYQKMPGKIFKPGIDKINRKHVDFYVMGKRHCFYVHYLVLLTFVGPRPEGMDCCHNDGNPLNNHVENLRYDTRSGNFKDKLLHGTHNRGENSPVHKLTEQQVLEIRSRSANGESIGDIAKTMPIGYSHTRDIIARKYWFHI